MIRAIVFDLDGTLVQSEKLKAQSYAIAVQRLRGLPEPEARAVEAYREIVGASREVASRHMVERLDLEEELRPLMSEHDASEPWQVISNMRKSISTISWPTRRSSEITSGRIPSVCCASPERPTVAPAWPRCRTERRRSTCCARWTWRRSWTSS